MKHLVFIAALLAAPFAGAHVSLEQKSAVAGSYQKLTFRVGHGCAASATTGITITLPEAMVAGGVKPMPKPGWVVTIGARDVAWRGGPLPDSQFDEFNVWLKLPDAPGKHAFKVLQQCEQGRADWVELPGVAGKFPAPVLEILPAAATGPSSPAMPAATHQH
jgi:uncharacterized protein YcnI